MVNFNLKSDEELLAGFIKKFKASKQGENDFIELLLAFNRSKRMNWEQVEKLWKGVK